MLRNKNGFTHLLLLLLLLAILITVGSALYFVNRNQKDNSNTLTEQGKSSGSEEVAVGSCPKSNDNIFTADVTDISKVNLVQTPIRLVGGQYIKTHSYIEVSEKSAIYAPMDATLTGGANYYENLGPEPVTDVQYLLSFNNGCDVNFWLDHIVEVTDKIKNAFPAQAQDSTIAVNVTKTTVKAGELLGYTNKTGRGRFDFGALNLKAPESSLTTNPRFKDDPIVKTSDKYRHAVCPYDLYTSEKLKAYQALYDPSAESDQEIIDDICN